MPKLRLSVALPTVQVGVTATLTQWASSVNWMVYADSSRAPGPFFRLDVFVIYLSEVWKGVNGPVSPLHMFTGDLKDGPLRYGIGDISYLGAVAVLWHLVGRYLDRRRGLEESGDGIGRKFSIFLAVWGVLLLGLAFLSIFASLIRLSDTSMYGNFILLLRSQLRTLLFELLILFWSLALIAFHGPTVTHAIRRKCVDGSFAD
jgi:hypothetical protein